jgi:hypothetical protein
MRTEFPDKNDAIISSAHSTEPLRFSHFPFHQPEHEDHLHAQLWGQVNNPHLQGVLLFVKRDNVWVESGKAVSPIAPSWHPDLGLLVGTEIDIARHVIRAIPRGMHIAISPYDDGEGKVGTCASFWKHAVSNPSKQEHLATDAELDIIPMVRRVERLAGGVAEHLDLKFWDNGEGLMEGFFLDISTYHLVLDHIEFESDILIRLRSEFDGSTWKHHSQLLIPSDDDPISILRTLQLGACSVPKILGQFIEDDNKLRALISSEAKIQSVELAEHDNAGTIETRIVLSIEPGTLFS